MKGREDRGVKVAGEEMMGGCWRCTWVAILAKKQARVCHTSAYT